MWKSPKTEKTDVASPSSYTGYEVEGRLRGLYTVFYEGTAVPTVEELRASLTPGLGHVYLGVHQRDVSWESQNDAVWALVHTFPTLMFTIEQGFLTVHTLPLWLQQHERVRLILRVTGCGELVNFITPRVEVKLDGTHRTVLLALAQDIDTTYLQDASR